MSDLFNNISNDYINPDLAPCSGQSDSYTFEFLPGQQAGILSGSAVLSAMALGDISQVVEGWVQQTKIVQPGEVVFIQGLTKGITTRTQYFPLDGTVVFTGNLDYPYYMSADLSINYYKNFKYYQNALHVTADYTLGIDIANALNIGFSDLGISVSAAYDPSGLTFMGSPAGYSFDITAIDVSLWEPDASIWGESLTEDPSMGLPAFKYPNSGMLGYILKVTYPSVAEAADSYIQINHAPDYLAYYEASTGDPNSYVRYYKAVDVGLSGASISSDTMSAAEYLDYVQSNNKWEKVGVLRAWLTAEDPESSLIENLITGFYVFNPQIFAIKIDYMTIIK